MTTSAPRSRAADSEGGRTSGAATGRNPTAGGDRRLRRILAWIIDMIPVAALFLALWVAGSDVLESRSGACDPAPAPNCNVIEQSDRLDDAGNVVIEFTLVDGRVIASDHTTFELFGTVYIADPPTQSAYLVTLAYVVLVFVGIQGTTGWTPGKLVTGLRLADDSRRTPGLGRALLRWALPDGALGIVGVVAAVVGAVWPMRLFAAFGALGVVRFLGGVVPALAGPFGDRRIGVRVIARDDFIGGRPDHGGDQSDVDVDDGEADDGARPVAGADATDAGPADTNVPDTHPTGTDLTATDPTATAVTDGDPAEPVSIIDDVPRGEPDVTALSPATAVPAAAEPAEPVEPVGAPTAVEVDEAVEPAATTGPVAVDEPVPTADLPVSADAVAAPGSGPATGATADTPAPTTITARIDITDPDVAEADSTDSRLAGTDITDPEITGPEITDPEVVNPDVAEADVTDPDVPEAGSTGTGGATVDDAAEATAADDAPAEGPAVPSPSPDGPEPVAGATALPASGAATTPAPQTSLPGVRPAPSSGAGPTAITEDEDEGTTMTDLAAAVGEVLSDADDERLGGAAAGDEGAAGDEAAEHRATGTGDDAPGEATPGEATPVVAAVSLSADNPYKPQWDQARRAYICWEPVSSEWLQWDDDAKAWGPISR